MAEVEPWRKYVPVIDHLLWQAYYRVLGFISFPAPVDESFQAVQNLSEQLGGKVYWVPTLEGRVFRWDDVEFSPGLKMGLWFVGSKIRGKNTVMCRRGWWTLYLTEPILLIAGAGLGRGRS